MITLDLLVKGEGGGQRCELIGLILIIIHSTEVQPATTN